MNSVIEYRGINWNYPPTVEVYQEDVFEEAIEINDIYHITKLSVNPKISIEKIITTPKGKNADGIELTGLAACTYLEISCLMEYIGRNNSLELWDGQFAYHNYLSLHHDFININTMTPYIYVQYVRMEKHTSGLYLAMLCATVINY